MDFLTKLLDKHSWTYHMRGGYYTREIINGDDLDQSAKYVAALEARLKEAEEMVENILSFPHYSYGGNEAACAMVARAAKWKEAQA